MASLTHSEPLVFEGQALGGLGLGELDPVMAVSIAEHLLLHKPLGYVCSRRRDTPQTQIVYDLLPPTFLHRRPPVVVAGRLDKWASGLVLMSQDGPSPLPSPFYLLTAYYPLSLLYILCPSTVSYSHLYSTPIPLILRRVGPSRGLS